ncbi:hypothetical protein DND132_1949 [Pseudodesulfovibrio mercurii]|uniref:Uncharacterized protein n=1 Tax=Pseudodesulfovibrio mercurii TaxID=641491 RepID=F0JGW5_9BACT|nr:hypothetical protein [Pseudodesulfovibrio mercurii]EGB15155.1 hypothetical protein DND132_1949 [Pseudodesulfovibrio mercurii]
MELLIAMEARNGYLAGDVLDVKPDGFPWGDEEHLAGKASFLVTTAPEALSREELIQPVVNLYQDEGTGDPLSVETLYKRRYYIDLAQIPQETIDRLLSVSWEVLSADGLLRSRV